jgi:hypothetical protein
VYVLGASEQALLLIERVPAHPLTINAHSDRRGEQCAGGHPSADAGGTPRLSKLGTRRPTTHSEIENPQATVIEVTYSAGECVKTDGGR